MSKPTNRRWRCPKDKHQGCLAPLKLRKIDVRRYCLPCSETEGVLVERVCDVRERKVQRAKERAASKARSAREHERHLREQARERERAARRPGGVDIAREYDRVLACALVAFEDQIHATDVRRALEGASTCVTWLRAREVTVYAHDRMRHNTYNDGVNLGMRNGASAGEACAFVVWCAASRLIRELKLNATEVVQVIAEAAYDVRTSGTWLNLCRVMTEHSGWPNTGRAPRRPPWIDGYGPAVGAVSKQAPTPYRAR